VKPGTTLRIQVVDSNLRPLSLGGVIVNVLFFVRGTERYRFDAGETAADGSLVVTYDGMEAIRQENQKSALMDYNTRLDDCDDAIVVGAASKSELDARLKSLEKWFLDDAAQLRQRIAAATNNSISATAATVCVHDAGERNVQLICERR
jgi:hypothetical protein